MPDDDDDSIDGCDVDLTEDVTPDDALDLVALSPDGDPARIAEYQALLGGA